ncbi:MAG: radical SAM protein, partial [Oscillospiraceae bacterium]|nr:radical SAM protein [Oscillospiraceae bacterium]
GRPDSTEHAIESARLVSATKPEYLGLLTLHLYADTPLGKAYRAGKFPALSPLEDLKEQKLFLENVDSEGTILRSNHVSNFLSLAGTLNRDREKMITQLEAAISVAESNSGKLR